MAKNSKSYRLSKWQQWMQLYAEHDTTKNLIGPPEAHHISDG